MSRAPWIQFRLNTLLVLTFATAVLLYLNFVPEVRQSSVPGYTISFYGWPFKYRPSSGVDELWLFVFGNGFVAIVILAVTGIAMQSYNETDLKSADAE
ncbi:MAG TPA: hypothetical protein VEK08_12370 [Planctomycetota bacterium]|nr:hypothetical protein [Planctomycetota bacterium]